MKHLYYLLLAIILLPCHAANAQLITTSPTIVQRSSNPIVITFHADQGNKGLMGLTSSTPVYAHTGIIRKGSTKWEYAPQWLDNSAKYKLSYVSANTWQLTIPGINEYYGITNAVEVEKLAFVFRNANGSKEGKTAAGGDIFVNVVQDNEFELTLTSSAESEYITQARDITFTATTTSSADIDIYLNSTTSSPVASAKNATTLTKTIAINTPGTYNVIARATSGTKTATQTSTVTYLGQSTQTDYPGGIPQMGAKANSDGSVTFCLAAPDKSNVLIVGSWNEYDIATSQPMHYQDYNGNRYFWATISGLAADTDYPYYYLVDGQYKVGDPYANLVLDPWNDRYISPTVFPDMPPYPSDKVSDVPLAVYNSSINDYEWKIKNFKGVDQSALVIYELLIRDFNGTEGQSLGNGTIAGVMEKLDYLKELGVNAIELLPVMEFNGNNSWGYNPNFYFAPDKAYGTPDDYRKLVDAIHERGMAVILDVVFNQSDGLHPWYRMYDIDRNPFYNGTAPHSYSVLNDWNQDNQLVQQQFKDALIYWLTSYNVDGFRFDLVKGLGSNQSYNATYDQATNTWSGVTEDKTNAYNASRVARMKELHDAMRTVKPDAYFINEDLAGAKEENEMAEDNETNWANINNASCQFAMGWQSGSNLNRFYAPLDDNRIWGSTVSYSESHDEERMAYKCEQWGNTGIKGNVAMTMRRLGSVAAMMLMSPGAHMIWQFQEFGADETTKNSDGSNNTSPKKVVWNYLNDPDRAGLKQSYSELCAIRNGNPQMFKEGVTTVMSCDESNWANGRTIKLSNGTDELYCIVNPNITGSKAIDVPFAKDAAQYHLLSASYGVEPSLSGKSVTLPAGAYAVYGTAGMTDIEEIIDDVTPQVNVYGGIGEIIIEGDYRELDIFNISGQRIRGTSGLPATIYIVIVDGTSYKVVVR